MNRQRAKRLLYLFGLEEKHDALSSFLQKMIAARFFPLVPPPRRVTLLIHRLYASKFLIYRKLDVPPGPFTAAAKPKECARCASTHKQGPPGRARSHHQFMIIFSTVVTRS